MSPIEPNGASEGQHRGGPETTRIEVVTPAGMHRAVATMVLSFAGDPVMRYWMPEPDAYLDGFPAIVAAFGGRAFEHGTAYATDRHSGAALWLPPGVEPDREALIASFARAVPDEKQETLFAIAEQMDGYHLDGPHWYLPLIGVDPARQRSGLGSALMEHALRQCDRDRLPAYLESTNPANLPLYQRHGFRVLGTIRVADVPPIFPMLRSRRDEDPVIPDDRRAT
jgi:ribosomal protein S18 acetylase RimI-like enzyme